MANTTIKGKALEFATLSVLEDCLLSETNPIEINESPAYLTAKSSFEQLEDHAKLDYIAAAKTAVEMIIPLEPRLLHSDDQKTLLLQIQPDSRGKKGDVRDIVCMRLSQDWEIGISCKHNHEALKHPRVTDSGNFGLDWLGCTCSRGFLESVRNITTVLEQWEKNNCLWRDIDDKYDKIYIPVIEAYIKEIERLSNTLPDVPARLLTYFFGTQDFYKVIAKDNRRAGDAGISKVMAFNTFGTLGQASKSVRPIHKVKRTKLPTRLIDISRIENNKTSFIMTFDGGWVIKMRLHNADSKVKKTGLKWDVTLEGLPSNMLEEQKAWFAN